MKVVIPGAKLANRKGKYLVLSLDGKRAKIRYENGQEEEAEIDYLERISEKIESNRISVCWKCKHHLNDSRDKKCSTCGWLICPQCEACNNHDCKGPLAF
jgi:peptide methionine sulfoxide reductase MsrB